MSTTKGGAPVPPPIMPPVYSQPPVYPAPQKTGKGIIALIVVLVVVLLIAMATTFSSLGQGSLPWSKQIAVISLDGTIGEDSGANSPEGLLSQLNEAEQDDSIVAVVMRVDSGGGLSAAGEEMATMVKNFSKPIVVSTGSSNASAAYLISSQTDWIYASNSSSVGSIGSAMQSYDYSGLLDMLGIEVTNITSSEGKDSSYGTRAMTDEEKAHYQEMVDEVNNYFIKAVAEGRGMSEEDVRALANGLVFTGADGINYGLIDEIGTFEDACDKAAELAGVSSYDVIYLDSGDDQIDKLLSLLASSNTSTELKELVTEGITHNDSVSQ